MIKVWYAAVDGFTEAKTFKTVACAQRYCVMRIGAHPEFGHSYAISGDGVGRIQADCSMETLFPPPAAPAPAADLDECLTVDPGPF